MVFNEMPVLTGDVSKLAAVNEPLTLTVTAMDPEGDKLDLAAVGGTWPSAPTPLPSGATFTDNGNCTGNLTWTPPATGTFPFSFMARDFAGRKTSPGMRAVGDDPGCFIVIPADARRQHLRERHRSLVPLSRYQLHFHLLQPVLYRRHHSRAHRNAPGWLCLQQLVRRLQRHRHLHRYHHQVRNVTATFTKFDIPTYSLAVAMTGSGTVHSTPDWISTARPGRSKPYPQDTTVTLTTSSPRLRLLLQRLEQCLQRNRHLHGRHDPEQEALGAMFNGTVSWLPPIATPTFSKPWPMHRMGVPSRPGAATSPKASI